MSDHTIYHWEGIQPSTVFNMASSRANQGDSPQIAGYRKKDGELKDGVFAKDEAIESVRINKSLLADEGFLAQGEKDLIRLPVKQIVCCVSEDADGKKEKKVRLKEENEKQEWTLEWLNSLESDHELLSQEGLAKIKAIPGLFTQGYYDNQAYLKTAVKSHNMTKWLLLFPSVLSVIANSNNVQEYTLIQEKGNITDVVNTATIISDKGVLLGVLVRKISAETMGDQVEYRQTMTMSVSHVIERELADVIELGDKLEHNDVINNSLRELNHALSEAEASDKTVPLLEKPVQSRVGWFSKHREHRGIYHMFALINDYFTSMKTPKLEEVKAARQYLSEQSDQIEYFDVALENSEREMVEALVRRFVTACQDGDYADKPEQCKEMVLFVDTLWPDSLHDLTYEEALYVINGQDAQQVHMLMLEIISAQVEKGAHDKGLHVKKVEEAKNIIKTNKSIRAILGLESISTQYCKEAITNIIKEVASGDIQPRNCRETLRFLQEFWPEAYQKQLNQLSLQDAKLMMAAIGMMNEIAQINVIISGTDLWDKNLVTKLQKLEKSEPYFTAFMPVLGRLNIEATLQKLQAGNKSTEPEAALAAVSFMAQCWPKQWSEALAAWSEQNRQSIGDILSIVSPELESLVSSTRSFIKGETEHSIQYVVQSWERVSSYKAYKQGDIVQLVGQFGLNAFNEAMDFIRAHGDKKQEGREVMAFVVKKWPGYLDQWVKLGDEEFQYHNLMKVVELYDLDSDSDQDQAQKEPLPWQEHQGLKMAMETVLKPRNKEMWKKIEPAKPETRSLMRWLKRSGSPSADSGYKSEDDNPQSRPGSPS